ncbi:MAG: phosphate ABC transporter substrate-binding protein PstS [Dehalococcoidales bacterium]|nr:phosphate ABC transporter substrate-binding protein PstS [Dehalococcoidales bacterium]
MAILVSVVMAGCTATPTTAPATPGVPVTTPSQPVNLNGAGATFPYPLYSKWFDEYNKLTGVQINYQSIGSGGGISQVTAGTVDFGASDGIMTDTQIAASTAAGGAILHIPMTSGAVVVIYNVPGIVLSGLKLTPDILADIYLKKITMWNDPRISSQNPGVGLPNTSIAVVHRSDGSGTTNIFTNYLSKVSPEWATKVGNANSVNWPGDIGGSGNAGVAGQVVQIPGAIGYVELAYALQNNIMYATMQNAKGNYIVPSLVSTTAAAQGVTLPDDTKVMLTNSDNPDAYPIVGFTWILAYANQTDKNKGQTLVNFLWWAIHDGQQFTEPLGYAKLSSLAVTRAENEILSIKYQGQPLLTR